MRNGFTALLLLLATAPRALGDAPSRAQQRCIVELNRAGAKIAVTGARALVGCAKRIALRQAPGGETLSACAESAAAKRVARIESAAARATKRACATPPSFGPTSAAAVAAAFAATMHPEAVFGPTLISARQDRAGASCQGAIVRGMVRVAAARASEFTACTTAGLRNGVITSAAEFAGCLDSDAHGRVARALRAAQHLASARCRSVPVVTACPDECADVVLGDLFACLGRRVGCDFCLTASAADGIPATCHRFVQGIATPYCGTRPTTTQSVARQWDEETLAAIRRDNPRPPVHARNLFHVSMAMYNAWAAYDGTAKPYLSNEHATSTDVEGDRAVAISFAAYRVLSERYSAALALGSDASQASFDARMIALGFDKSYTSTTDPTPAALGNHIAAAVIAFGQSDGANEAANYADPTYMAVNQPLVVKVPDIDFATIIDINHWQPLALDVMIGQNGVPLPGNIQKFVGSQWGKVTPFALMDVLPSDVDPGPQPKLGDPVTDTIFKDQVKQLVDLSGELTPDDGAMIDISPALRATPSGLPGGPGNNPLETNDGLGYPANPVTGQPYAPQLVPRGDFGRVIAEYWADGPTSETPPGHWNLLANTVADDPRFEKRFGGTGPLLSALEWDVKTYFAVNAAVHDAAIACWGAKRKYDGVRPITMIRYMGKKGQSFDSMQPSYDPSGLPLEPNVIELITPQTAAPGGKHADLVAAGAHVNDIAIFVWPGGPADPTTQHSGVKWILAKGWNPYQRNTFVSPAFPGYYSGHSTFSRAAAEVLAAITGSPFFPGGLGEFLAPQNHFLKFEEGPSIDVRLQWATYFDAADQAGQSRLWGGIHVIADDFKGRHSGQAIGLAVFKKATSYFAGTPRP